MSRHRHNGLLGQESLLWLLLLEDAIDHGPQRLGVIESMVCLVDCFKSRPERLAVESVPAGGRRTGLPKCCDILFLGGSAAVNALLDRPGGIVQLVGEDLELASLGESPKPPVMAASTRLSTRDVRITAVLAAAIAQARCLAGVARCIRPASPGATISNATLMGVLTVPPALSGRDFRRPPG